MLLNLNGSQEMWMVSDNIYKAYLHIKLVKW